jgi:hypothetical protein
VTISYAQYASYAQQASYAEQASPADDRGAPERRELRGWVSPAAALVAGGGDVGRSCRSAVHGGRVRSLWGATRLLHFTAALGQSS